MIILPFINVHQNIIKLADPQKCISVVLPQKLQLWYVNRTTIQFLKKHFEILKKLLVKKVGLKHQWKLKTTKNDNKNPQSQPLDW